MESFHTLLTRKYFWIVFAIILLGSALRGWKYWSFPVAGETQDELAWTFLGSSLLEVGRPISWSHFPVYQPFEVMQIGADRFPIVQPALDHPPLFSLIPGVMHALDGRWESVPSIKVIRFPMIGIGILSVLAFGLLSGSFFSSRSTQVLALSLFATIPSVVFGSRLVVAENFLVLLWILSFWIVLWPRQHRWFEYRWYLLSVISCAAVLSKVSGVVLPVSLIAFGLLEKDTKMTQAGLVGGLIGAVAFSVYGVFFDAQVFMKIIFSQGNRAIGLGTIMNRFLVHPTIVLRNFMDPWIPLGLCTALCCFFAEPSRKWRFFQIGVVMNLLFILAAVGETTVHGWYAYVLFPFFCISIAWCIEYLVMKQQTLGVWALWLWLVAIFRFPLLAMFSRAELVSLTRPFALLGGIPLAVELLNKKQAVKWAIVGVICSLLLANVLTDLTLSAETYWADDEYFVPKVITR